MFDWLKRKLGLTFEPEKYPLLTAWQRERGTSNLPTRPLNAPEISGQGQKAETDPYARKPDESEADHLCRLLEMARNK